MMWYEKEINYGKLKKAERLSVDIDSLTVSSAVTVLLDTVKELNGDPDHSFISYDGEYLEVGVFRLETDEEQAARIKRDQEYNKVAREERRKLKEKLDKEFE